MIDATEVWIELEKLWRSGKLRAAVLEDWQTVKLASDLVVRPSGFHSEKESKNGWPRKV